MDIRDAVEGDLPGILEIYNEVVANSTAIYRDDPSTLDERLDWWRARVALGYPVLVAIDASGVVGCASFGDFRAWPGYRCTVEHSVYVRTDRRGQGLGPQLVRALIPRARALGKHVMIAGIDADNAGSIRMHAALGFERVAHFREVGAKFGRWLDLVFMQLRLDDRQSPGQSQK